MTAPDRVLEVLQKYWGYTSFRPMQREIIDTVLEERDSLALLPTGGGKSLCYQVPALVREGVCVVVSPLVALMKDQVERLNALGVQAEAIYAGIGSRSIDRILDNCVYGNTKLLYMSPERLRTRIAEERIRRMNLSFLAVDEAHCISQWGHDFRPAYLDISTVREWQPGVPILALTATATNAVVADIKKQLDLRDPAFYRASFKRPNLAFKVAETENKPRDLLQSARRSSGTGIVYVRSRRRTRDVTGILKRGGVTSAAYHAGMSHEEREKVQRAWLEDRVPWIACTTAFGMGIDKSDVRSVLHYDIPGSLEEYYQEAGRAGRDGAESECLLLFNRADVKALEENVERSFPGTEKVREVLRALYAQYYLPIDSDEPFDTYFDLSLFCKKFKLGAYHVFQSMRTLEKEGWLILSESIYSPSRLAVTASKATIARIDDEIQRSVLTAVLRKYEGVFIEPVKINEADIARTIEEDPRVVKTALAAMGEQEIIHYQPTSDQPRLTFLHPRVEVQNVTLDEQRIESLRKNAFSRMKAVKAFLNEKTCREQAVLRYFDETRPQTCGKCDLCMARTAKVGEREILSILEGDGANLQELFDAFPIEQRQRLKEVLADLEREGAIRLDKDGKLQKTSVR